MTETILTDDDVAALEALESGSSLTDDQVGRLQTLENTPFFADSIKQSESASQRFTGAGFADDGSYASANAASPMVQAQQDPVPPVQGPVRSEDEPAPQQPPEDGMQFNLVTPPPAYVEERQTNIRGPRLGAMGPAMESGDFYANDEEMLDALYSAPAQGRVLTFDEFQTREELAEKENDKLGALKSGAGMMAAGLWEMAKGMAIEQGATVPAAIGHALGDAVFDPTNAANILKQGMVEASNRAVQGEVTKVEGARKGYIGMRQIWSWLSGFIENDQIATDQRQAVMADLRQTGAFGADSVANAQLVEQEIAKRREQGLAPFAPTDRTQEFETKYQRYLENEKLNRAYTGQNQYLMGEQVVNERPGIVADQLVTAFNPITGQQVEPLPYTSMGYGMMYQLDTYVGFGAGYISKARVASRAAAAARPLFSFAENTATKAAEVAKTGRDAHKFLTMSNIASGGALATGIGMQFNQSTGDFGKALMFFGGIKPAMRATGFVFKKVPGGSKVMEAAGVFRPQALRIIAEESKAGPLGAGATAQTPATQAAAIRAARPEAAQRLVNGGSVPDRYARFMGTSTTRAGDVKLSAPGSRGFDSTLKRVAQNPENPPNVRRAARAADEIGLTQAFRTTDDAISGALAGLVGSSPFAAIAPDDQTAGGILAVGTAFGAAGGIAGGVTSFKGDAVDADIARFMVDTEAYGGDPQALFQIPRRDLAAMAALQSMSVNKGVDFVALRTEDYWLNVPEAKGAQGYFAAGTAKDGSTPGRMRLFVDLGHSVVQEGGIARVVKADDGMYELTVVRPDGKVMYPAPASDGSQPVIRRKSPNDFNVKDGDPVSPYSPLNRQPPRIVTSAHEFMHALMNSDMFGGDHQGALRGLIYDQYKPETINSMAREYARRLVDAQINNGAVPKPTNDEAKAKLIDDMMTELSDDSVAKTGDQRAWIADEILAETWQDVAQTTDINRLRQGKSADGRLTDAARSIMVATTRALETFGMKFDWATGRPLTNPSTIFRDNPLANNPLIRKRLLESVRNYDRYLTLLEDAGAVESKGSPLPRSGKAEDWLAEGTMRTHDMGGGIKENDVMIVDPDGQVRWKLQDQIDNEYRGRQTGVKDLLKRLGTRKVGENDPTFGLRDAGPLRTIYSGAELPMENSALGYPPVLASFPKWYREMYMDTILPARRAGETVRFSNNTVGTRSDQGGPYKLKQLISSGFAKQSEGVPYGVQITKSGNHINIEMIDLNAFKAATLKAINDGKLSYFNNDYKQVVAGLKQLMDNYRNKRDGSYMIGPEGKNILNGLLYGKSRANQGYGAMLNPRGSIRTYRMDRMNWMERTGDTGYFFDNDRAKNNRMPETEPVDGPNNNRMPSALPQSGMAMPEVPVAGSRGMPLDEDWGLYAEELRGDVDSWSPARDTGRHDYDMQDVVDSFVDFARDNPQMTGSELTTAFYRAEKPTASQRKKLNAAIANVGEPPRVATGGTRGQAMPDAEIQQRFPQHRFVSGGQPTMLKTGEPVVLKMHHATRRPAQLMKSGKFDDKYLGETHGAENDFLGWYFSSDYLVGDDGEYVGKRGEVLPFYVRMDNPLVIDTDRYPFIEDAKRSREVAQLRDAGGHDGIIAVITGTSRIGNFEPPTGVKEIYDQAVDLTADKFRDLPEKLQDTVDKEDQIYRDWFEGKRPEAGSEILSLTPNATKLLDSVDPEFSDAVSSIERRRSTGKDGIAAQTWWAIVPPENKGQIKSAEAITRDKSGNVIPLSKRFDQSKPDIRFMPDVGEPFAPNRQYNQDLPEITSIDISRLRVRDAGEVRQLTPERIEEYRKYLNEPIEVSVFKRVEGRDNGELMISDGHHRVAAARALGVTRLPARVKAINAFGSQINELLADQRVGASRGQAMTDVGDVSSGLPRRSMESRGGAKIDEDGTVTFQGREPKDWAPEDFAKFGKEFGVRNLGPLSKVSNIVDELGRPLAQIPGGLEGKFTYYDLLWLKANPVDVKSLPVELHGKLTAKLARTMTPERGNDVQKFNGILFGMLSPNSPLLPNEFGQARMRFESMDDIRRFASLLPDNPTKEQRKAVNKKLKKELGFTSAKSGGLGIGISVDLSNIVMAAKMFAKKPDFFIKKPNESWANFVDKLTTQVGGLGTKTASFGGVWQDPLMAGISAMDRHMARAFSEELLNNPEIRGRFEGMVVKRFNDLTAKSKKTAQKADAKIRRAKTDKARAKAIEDKQDAMQNLPDPTALKAETLDDVLGQAEVFGADRIKDFVNEAVFAAMGSRKAKYLVKGGAVNPKLPESLQGVEWVEQPKDFQVMSDAYRLALEINAKRAKEIGIEVFPSQWTLWDRIRGRVEPHEAMFPGLEKLPALNDKQLAAAYAANKQAGYARNVKAGQEWKRKSGLSPSSLAYFTPAVLAAGAAASATEEQ